MAHKPAGRIESKNNVQPKYKVGIGARGMDKNWASQIGGSQGNHATNKGEPLRGVRADPYKGPDFRPAKLGNEIAAASTCGPGGSRDIYKSGAQHGLTTRANVSKGRSLD